jgi:hypothetical protein
MVVGAVYQVAAHMTIQEPGKKEAMDPEFSDDVAVSADVAWVAWIAGVGYLVALIAFVAGWMVGVSPHVPQVELGTDLSGTDLEE